jgi:hypothetical protein
MGAYTRRGGSQIMHFTEAERIHDCIATAKLDMSLTISRVDHFIDEGLVTKSEKALFVYLAAHSIT